MGVVQDDANEMHGWCGAGWCGSGAGVGWCEVARNGAGVVQDGVKWCEVVRDGARRVLNVPKCGNPHSVASYLAPSHTTESLTIPLVNKGSIPIARPIKLLVLDVDHPSTPQV